MAYNNVKVKERQTVTPSSQTKQLGIVSEVPMNEWNADVPYEKLNLVTYKNGTFIAKEASKGFPPLDTDGWEAVWMPLLNGVGIASTVTEYALGEADSSVPPQDGWSSDIPTPKAGKYLWTRVTITYTNGERVIFYAVGAAGSVSKTSELENDGDGTSPFATQKELVAETARAQAAEQTNARAVETERARAEAAEQANAKGIETNAKAISDETTRAKGVESGLANRVTAIETVIPSGASATDQLSTQSFVNSSINALAAFYITYNASGAAFPSKAALFGATTFYQGGKTRVPTQNDYAIVLADESKEKGVDGSYPTTRYSYQGGTYPAGQWDFQYIVNNTSLTQAQVDALNSGITAAGVAQIETNKSDIAALKTKNTEQDNAIKTAQSTADNAQSAAEAAQRTANSKYSKPSGGIPATDLAGDIPTSKITGLATVATSGDYNDLLHKPAAYSLPIATATVLGGVKSSTTGTDGTDYKVQVNADGTMKVNVPSPDLSGYAKLSDDNEFTGTNTFKEQIKVGGSILYTTVSENGVYHDGDEIGFDLNNNGLKLWSGGEDETSTTYKNGRITRNDNVNIALPSTSGELALKSDVKWANLPDKPTIPTIPSSLPPSGTAGGDLSGTYPNPVIKTGAVTKAKLESGVQALLNKADTALQPADIPNVTITDSGSGNAVTAISAVGHTITVTKGETFAKNADLTTLQTRVTTIEGKIPTQASATNQLADIAFVNSTVQTATANFRGNWATWAAVPTAVDSYPADYAGGKTPTVNDYLVVQDASGYSGKTLTGTWRFKYSGAWGTNGKNGWQPEYQVNETPLTAAQLSALNSGATAALIGQITTNKNAIATVKTTADNAMPKAGGTFTGAVTFPGGASVNTSGYVTGTWLRTTAASDLNAKAAKIAVIGTDGSAKDYIYYRTPAEILTDIGALPIAGGTLKGELSFDNYAAHWADKETGQYVDIDSSTISVIRDYGTKNQEDVSISASGVAVNQGTNSAIYTNSGINYRHSNGFARLNFPKKTSDETLATLTDITWANVKPSGGIVKTDLASSVQTSLNKADSAVLTSAQSLTDVQKRIARENIGAGTPYALPAATADMRGGIQVGYNQNGNNYPLQLDRITGRAYVTIPAAQFDIDAAFLAAHPVKSLYWSDDPTSPATHGGTWEELPNGTFIMAAGSGGTAGQTGGTSSVTLEIANLPEMRAYLEEYNLRHGSDPDFGENGTYLSRGVMGQYYNPDNSEESHWGWDNSSTQMYPAAVTRGSSKAFDIVPPYCSTHIWRRVA